MWRNSVFVDDKSTSTLQLLLVQPTFLQRKKIKLYITTESMKPVLEIIVKNPSALIIIVHQAPPLLARWVTRPRSQQISLNWVACWASPEHCAALLVWGNSNQDMGHLALEMTLERSRAMSPSWAYFCVPQRKLSRPPARGLSDPSLRPSQESRRLLVQDCQDPLTRHYTNTFRAAFDLVEIIIGTRSRTRLD